MTSRKKGCLLGCGAVLVLVLGFVVWWSRNPIVFTAPEGAFAEIKARQLEDPSGNFVVVELELSGDAASYTVTDLSVSRELAEALGLSAPEGFREEPLPLEAEDLEDPESVSFVEEWNAENLRWAGGFEIEPATPIVVRIPADRPEAATGPLTISYERVGTFGGHWSSAEVVLNENREEEAGGSSSSPHG